MYIYGQPFGDCSKCHKTSKLSSYNNKVRKTDNSMLEARAIGLNKVRTN